MKLNFRQGVWKARVVSVLPDYLEYDPDTNTMTIDITNVTLVVSLAFRNKNYLIEYRETLAEAWGPLIWNGDWGIEPDVDTFYLYWNIDVATGMTTRGFTPLEPIYSFTEPVDPGIDQHWFDKNQNIFQVWDGIYWRPRARLFAGFWNGVITTYDFGSQIGLTYPDTLDAPVDSGYILYGQDMKGVRDADATFVTTAQPLSTYHGSFTSAIRLELASSTFVAAEPIPQYSAVTNNGDGTISLANGLAGTRGPIGLAYADAAAGEPVDIVSQGILYNDAWEWDPSAGKSLFCGDTGDLIQGDVNADNRTKVAWILDTRYVLVHIDEIGGGDGSTADLTLEHDVLINGTSVGAQDSGYTFMQGITFTQFVDIISKKAHISYSGPTLSIDASPEPTTIEMGTIIDPITITEAFSPNNAGAVTARNLSRNATSISLTYPYADAAIQMTESSVNYQGFVSYAQGPVLTDNLGNLNPAGQIQAGTIASNIITFIGTRNVFYGFPSGAVPTDSAGVRGLGNTSFNSGTNGSVDSSGVAYGSTITPNFVITIPVGAVKVTFAYPATVRDVASVRYQELSDSEVKANFVLTTVTVQGANAYNPISYKVWTYTPVEPFSQSVHYRIFL